MSTIAESSHRVRSNFVFTYYLVGCQQVYIREVIYQWWLCWQHPPPRAYSCPCQLFKGVTLVSISVRVEHIWAIINVFHLAASFGMREWIDPITCLLLNNSVIITHFRYCHIVQDCIKKISCSCFWSVNHKESNCPFLKLCDLITEHFPDYDDCWWRRSHKGLFERLWGHSYCLMKTILEHFITKI